MKSVKQKQRIKIVIFLTLVFIIFPLIAPWLAPHSPLETNFKFVLQPPSKEYPFGTDQVGRCVFSRVLCGARISISLVFLLLAILSSLGILIGIVAGATNRTVDTLIMRISDTILAFPDLVLAIAIVGIIGPGTLNTILALSVIWWTKYARFTRILVKEIINDEFVDAGIMAGASWIKIIFIYVLPNITPQIIIQLALDVGSMMLTLAGLSFLGLGIQPPTPEWGNMLNEGRIYLQTSPWLLIYPGSAIFIVVAVFSIQGDIIRDLLDPKEI